MWTGVNTFDVELPQICCWCETIHDLTLTCPQTAAYGSNILSILMKNPRVIIHKLSENKNECYIT